MALESVNSIDKTDVKSQEYSAKLVDKELFQQLEEKPIKKENQERTSKATAKKANAEVQNQENLKNLLEKATLEQEIKDKDGSITLSKETMDFLLEANAKKINPIELAFQRLDLELAEELFKTGLFEHPGYEFSRKWKKGCLPVWMKPEQVVYLNEWGGERYFTLNKVDLEVLFLLMKYDTGPNMSLPMRNTNNYKGAKEWHFVYPDIMSHAYKTCDLEAIVALYPLHAELQGYPRQRFGMDFMGQPGYLVDPFLSDFPIDLNNPDHFFTGLPGKYAPNSKGVWMGPQIWDYRPEDTERIRELKRKLQQMFWDLISSTEIDNS